MLLPAGKGLDENLPPTNLEKIDGRQAGVRTSIVFTLLRRLPSIHKENGQFDVALMDFCFGEMIHTPIVVDNTLREKSRNGEVSPSDTFEV